MGFQINDRVKWVGKVDWELRTFHGEEYSTHRGSSYNSYLVRDEKTALIDTVWQPFASEFIEKLKQEVPVINEKLTEAGFELLNDGLKVLWNPDEPAIEECIVFGKKVGESLKETS